jgi:hypothetical protein
MLRFSLFVVALAVMVLAIDASSASARGRRGGMMNCNTAPATVPAKAENVKATAALRIYAPAASLASKVESVLKIDLNSLQALNERPTYRGPATSHLADR